ncbi:MAG: archaellin/type IV pilin N-terminal domain-containing protein [Candidatus Bathyarchaeia archaeon]
MNFKRMMKNSKAISPIFATLILIAIAVIAGVVVYMFTSGTLATMTSGGTAGQEKITVQGASVSVASKIATVYIEQTGGPAASVNSIIIKNSAGTTLGDVAVVNANITPSVGTTGTTIASGTLYTVSVTISAGILTGMSVGGSYTLTVTTQAGGSFVSSSTVAET